MACELLTPRGVALLLSLLDDDDDAVAASIIYHQRRYASMYVESICQRVGLFSFDGTQPQKRLKNVVAAIALGARKS